MAKVVTRGFDNHNFNVEPPISPLEIEELLKFVVSHLVGWNYLAKRWDMLICDSDGRLLVSSSKTKSDTGANSKVSVAVANTTLLADNPNRKQLVLQNTGAQNVYVNFGTVVDITVDMILEPNVSYTDEIYTGPLTGKVSAGTCDVRIVEMT